MARSKEQATTSPAKVGDAGPPVVNVSGTHWPGAEEVTRYSGPQHQERPTAAHRKPVMIDQAASNRPSQLTEACIMDGAGRHAEKRQQLRSAAESSNAGPSTRARLGWLTGAWPRFALERHEQPDS